MIDDRRFFFVHIMKTAGATFRQHLRRNFTAEQRYPNPELETIPAVEHNLLVDYVVGLPPARHDAIRCYAGHFPHVTTRLLPFEPATFTILRDPVDRVLSYLKQRRAEIGAATIEEVYADDFTRRCLLDDHQTKVFSLGVDDSPQSVMDVIELDEDRLRVACANLETVDVVGVTDRYDDFCADVTAAFGWRIGTVPDRRVSEPTAVDPALRHRIEADNQLDRRFYEYAVELIARRRAGSPVSPVS